jgi:putative SOS response-associated peptidase YedK
MCGRFTLRTPTRILVEQFQLGDVPDLAPRFNIAPTQDVPVVRVNPKTERRELALLHWGLIPFWAEEGTMAPKLKPPSSWVSSV